MFSTLLLSSSSLHLTQQWIVIHGCRLGKPSSFLTGFTSVFLFLCLSPHLLSRSRRHRRRHLSSGPPILRSSGLWCWLLRSCRLNCQSLWTSLIGRGGQPLMGGWDTHTHTTGGEKHSTHTHTGIWIHAWDIHELFMNMHVHKSHTMGDRTKTSRQHRHSSRDKGLESHRVKLSKLRAKAVYTSASDWVRNVSFLHQVFQ